MYPRNLRRRRAKRVPKRAGFILFNPSYTKVALVQTSNEIWSFPKGRQEKGETLLDTAQRELREETKITSVKIVSETTLIELSSGARPTILYFLAQADETDSWTASRGEIRQFGFYPISSALKLLLPQRQNLLKQALQALQVLKVKSDIKKEELETSEQKMLRLEREFGLL